jgi:hypothetical protein
MQSRIVPEALVACGILASLTYAATDIIASLRYPAYDFIDQTVRRRSARLANQRPAA